MTDVEMIESKPDDQGRMNIIVLEPVEPGVTPEYCTHGQTACIACGDWCWLGSESYEVVKSGRASPLCLTCARRLLPEDMEPVDNVNDHRRADGPHE